MNVHLTATEVLAGVGALVALVMIWRASARTARLAAEAARASVRVVSLAGRIGITAAVIAAVQWVVITHSGNSVVLWAVLGLPDLLAAHSLTRALTVTAVDTPRRRGGRG
ncbi:MAG TPA: hypothetical protein VFW65_39880 [Pseudonocardiaceae bacterium]|nr:hypothetical protein [Pseudonocardiaceae bacterium]